MLRFHAQTSGASLTAQQPLNNVVRVAVQALAAVCGGAQSLHTNSYDEALALPSAQAAEVALRTQQVIAHEAGVARVADPLGGAHALEHLTDSLIEEARALMDRVEELGGATSAIEAGFYHRQIQESAYRHQQQVESGRRVVVGVNRFTETSQAEVEIQRIGAGAGGGSGGAAAADAGATGCGCGHRGPGRGPARPPRAPTTCSPRSAPPSPLEPPWARSATRFATSSGSTGPSPTYRLWR